MTKTYDTAANGNLVHDFGNAQISQPFTSNSVMFNRKEQLIPCSDLIKTQNTTDFKRNDNNINMDK